jgi:ABC-type sugar transport system ATPase subunit
MIARALAQNARLLVLDEPSAALTEDEIEHLHKVVARLASEGVTVVYISHRLDEILGVSSRVVVMRDARVVAEHPTVELTHRRIVELITGGVTEIVRSRAERDRPPPDPGSAPLLVYEGEATGAFGVSVRPGEIVGLAGLVGSGRTELVRELFGADGGHAQATVGGAATTVARPSDAIRAGVVLLPEDRRSEGNIGAFSVKHNLTLVSLARLRVARWLRMPSARRETRAARAAIDRLQIRTDSPETPVRWLSGGNQQKVMLGKWLALDARVYIFDEPTVGIDVEAKEEAFHLIDDLARQGKGVVLISSDFSELVAMCDRVLILKEGRVVAERRGTEITEAALVEACYEAG